MNLRCYQSDGFVLLLTVQIHIICMVSILVISGIVNFISYLLSFSKGDATAIETELLRDYKFGQQQLIELWGQACALAITRVWINKFCSYFISRFSSFFYFF